MPEIVPDSVVIGAGTQPGTFLVRQPDGSVVEVDQNTAMSAAMAGIPAPGDGVATSLAETQAMMPPQVQAAAQSLPANLSQAVADSAAIQESLRTRKPSDESSPVAQATQPYSQPPQTQTDAQPFTSYFGGQEVASQPEPTQSTYFGGQEVPTTPEEEAAGMSMAPTGQQTPSPIVGNDPSLIQQPPTAAPGFQGVGMLGQEEANRQAYSEISGRAAAYANYLMQTGGNPGRVNAIRARLQELEARGELSAANLDLLKQQLLQEIHQSGEIGAMPSDLGAPVMQQYATGMQAREQVRQATEAAINKQMDQNLRDVAVLIDRARQVRLDPNRIFAGNGAARVSAAISAGVGAALQTTQGILFPGSNPENTALNIINTAIERDIQAQIHNYQRDVTDIENANSLVGALRARLGDNNLAMETARTMMQNQVLSQLQVYALQARSQASRNAVARVITQLQMQWEAQQQAGLQAAAEEERRRLARAVSGPPLRAIQDWLKVSTEANQAGMSIGEAGRQTLGANVSAAGELGAVGGAPAQWSRMGDFEFNAAAGDLPADMREEFKAVRERVTGANNILRYVRDMRAVLNDPDSDLATKRRQSAIVAARYMTAESLARLSERDLPYFEVLYGDRATILRHLSRGLFDTNADELAQLESMARSAVREASSQLPEGRIRMAPTRSSSMSNVQFSGGQ